MHSVQEGLPRQSSTAWAQPPSIDRVMSLSPSKQTKKVPVYTLFFRQLKLLIVWEKPPQHLRFHEADRVY